jgi:glycerophosphoryl diester phosphodiesterase
VSAGWAVIIYHSRPVLDHPYFDAPHFRIIAHRGGAGLGPENTIETFKRSLAAGADTLEMDLRMTKDGHIVILHDATVERTTDGEGSVEKMSLSQIKALDAGYRWTVDGGHSFPYRGSGLTIPKLEEVFQLFPGTPMLIEIKDRRSKISDLLCELIERYRKTYTVLIASFDTKVLKKFRCVCPQVASSGGLMETLTFSLLNKVGLTSLYGPKMQALHVPKTANGEIVATRQFVKAAHERNLKVEVWTVNDLDDLRLFMAAGVDGIMTDYPDRLLKLRNSIAMESDEQ